MRYSPTSVVSTVCQGQRPRGLARQKSSVARIGGTAIRCGALSPTASVARAKSSASGGRARSMSAHSKLFPGRPASAGDPSGVRSASAGERQVQGLLRRSARVRNRVRGREPKISAFASSTPLIEESLSPSKYVVASPGSGRSS